MKEYIDYLRSVDVSYFLRNLELQNIPKNLDFQKNYQNLFWSVFLFKLADYKQYINSNINLSRFFTNIPSEHKAILDLDTTQIYKYLISSAQNCDGRISRSCFNTFVNFNFEEESFLIITHDVLYEIDTLNIKDSEKKEFLIKLLESEDFNFYVNHNPLYKGLLDKTLDFISSLRINPIDFLQNEGSKITIKNSLKLAKHFLINSKFNKEFINFLIKDYIHMEHVFTVDFLFDSFFNENEMNIIIKEISKIIFSERVYRDFYDCSDKYQFLINLKSIIANYPRKLQRFILSSFIIDDDLKIYKCFITPDFTTDSVEHFVDSAFLTKILNDSDIDLSLISFDLFLRVIDSYGFEGFKKLYSDSEYKTNLAACTPSVLHLFPLILKDADINDEFIVNVLYFFNHTHYEEADNVFKNIEIDLVGCKRFFIVLKKLQEFQQNQPHVYSGGVIDYIGRLSLDNKSLFSLYRTFFQS